ncbi:hypothetical protein HDE_00399 [Halotydeus destructor]|nr:hypothetical protein HDE_00399 [Halotydeus destructor]
MATAIELAVKDKEIEQLRNELFLAKSQNESLKLSHQKDGDKWNQAMSELRRAKLNEEENLALKEQLDLQEVEIKKLEEMIKAWKQNMLDERRDHEIEHSLLKSKNSDFRHQVEILVAEKTKLVAANEILKTEKECLSREAKHFQSQLFEAKQDLERASQERSNLDKIREEHRQKQKDIIILGEMYQIARDKAECLNSNYFVRPCDASWTLTVDTLERERDKSRSELNETKRSCDFFKLRTVELERDLERKDAALQQLKNCLETSKNDQKRQLTIEKQRVAALERIVVRLEQHILNLYAELGLKKHEKRLQDLQLTSNHEYDSDSTDMSTSPNSNHNNHHHEDIQPMAESQNSNNSK